MVEVHNEEDNPKFAPHLEQKAQQGNGINSAGDRHAHTVSGLQQLLMPEVCDEPLCQ